MNSTVPVRDVDLIDATSLYDVAEFYGQRFGKKLSIDYPALKRVLSVLRSDHDWQPASVSNVFLSQDPKSEGQHRFQAMLERSGFDTDVSHYLESFVSLPPGMLPGESQATSISSFACRIAYILGLMARHDSASVVVISHSFELYPLISDLSARLRGTGGRVAMAYFGSALDHRWKSSGAVHPDRRVPEPRFEFWDLENFGEELIGVDLAGRPSSQNQTTAKLSMF